MIFLTVIQTPYIEFKEPNKYVFTVGSSIFFLGVVNGHLALRGKLEPKDPSVSKVRKQSPLIEKRVRVIDLRNIDNYT
ncbi:MAG: hypothetical protein BV456_07025 [Thermoplasmata archaeon M8B2D]|nr:MAG: hypothetical protein BV456_07025 [Thermoplasmata archaeon M8B2D]